MVDIVHFAMAVAQFNQRGNGGNDVFSTKNKPAFFSCSGQSFIQQTTVPRLLLVFRQFLLVGAGIEFHAANTRQIVAGFIEEQAIKQHFHRFFGRRLARAHHAVNSDTCRHLVSSFIHLQCRGNIAAMPQFIDI